MKEDLDVKCKKAIIEIAQEFKKSNKLKGIELGEDYTVNADDLQRIISKAKDEHSDIGLFKKSSINVNDVTPNMSNKSLNEMSSDELKEYARNNF